MSRLEPGLRRLVRCPRCGLEGVEGSMTFHDCHPLSSQVAILIGLAIVLFVIVVIVRLAHPM
jgi:hypothetical protein